MIKRCDITRINPHSYRLKWDKWFECYMMRGDFERIMFQGDSLTLHVFHIGRNWSKSQRIFWVLKEKRFYYEMDPESFNWKGESSFLLPWDLIDELKKKVIEDLEKRESLKLGLI